MGSMKLDLRSAPKDFHKTVERLHRFAFGPSPSLYRQISLCGWRPLIDHRINDSLFGHRFSQSHMGPIRKTGACVAVHETDDGITIEVTLSSLKEDSLHLAISGKMVIIRGEMLFEDQASGPLSMENNRKPLFQRVIRLPATINAGGFRAQLVDDIVQINFAKSH